MKMIRGGKNDESKKMEIDNFIVDVGMLTVCMHGLLVVSKEA